MNIQYNNLHIFNPTEWRAYRHAFPFTAIALPKETGHRGNYAYDSPAIISFQPVAELFDDTSALLKRIIISETALMWDGSMPDPAMVKRCYADDNALLRAYQSLQLHRLMKNNRSRNNIIQNNECCLCQWQYTGNTLAVYSRSMDIKAAGLSDIAVANNIAGFLGADFCTVIVHQPHIYSDNTTIARRHE